MPRAKPDLTEYHRKRNFSRTPEPAGEIQYNKAKQNFPVERLRFVIQKHAATQLHYDLRLEMAGDFKSWAVPKGPSLNPADQRLAVRVENHPIEYGSFEGIIPPNNYGAGTVMIWDAGWLYSRKTRDYEKGHQELLKGYDSGHITFILEGQKLRGEFALIRLKDSANTKAWLLVKKGDQFCNYKIDVLQKDRSVATGRTMEEIAKQAKAKGEVWIPGASAQSAQLKSPYIDVDKNSPQDDKNTQDAMPHRIKPMLPVLSKKLFLDKNWIYEPMFECTRAILEIDGKKISFYTRSGLSLTEKYPEFVRSLKSFPDRVVLDGQFYTKGTRSKIQFFVWDLLYSQGRDWRSHSLLERKAILAQLASRPNLIVNVWKKGEVPASASKKLLVRHCESDYRSGIQNTWYVCPNQLPSTEHKAPHIQLKKNTAKKATNVGPILTNLKKIYWPETGHTKGDVIAYYQKIAPFILPHLKDRPLALNRHPNGVTRPSFFQKDVTGYLPSFVETTLVQHSDKSVNYVMCQNAETLVYLANLGCIELNPWLSRYQSLDYPDWAVIDLDPLEIEFAAVIETAQVIFEQLKKLKIKSFCKTSGSKGLHILIPMPAKTDYDNARAQVEAICVAVNKKLPNMTSVERSPSKRRRRVYLDFMQNVWGKTLAAPYCLRPKSQPMVSMPIDWSEVNDKLRLENYTIETVPELIAKRKDPWKDLF